jgi:hypothetical protein
MSVATLPVPVSCRTGENSGSTAARSKPNELGASQQRRGRSEATR